MTTPPAASTSEAGTNTGASLCCPPETPPSFHRWDDEMEPMLPDHFSVRTATTSVMSRGTASNMHLDFPSFGEGGGGGKGEGERREGKRGVGKNSM